MKVINQYFDLFELHDKDFDRSSRSWIRVKGNATKKIFLELLPSDPIEFLQKSIKERTGISISCQTVKEWMSGRYGIPLIALDVVCANNKDKIRVLKSIKYLNTKSSHKIMLPKKPSKNLLYFCGVIIGDGCIPYILYKKRNEREWKVIIEMSSTDYVYNILTPLSKTLFNISPITCEKHRDGRRKSVIMNINSKIVYRFLEKVIGIGSGKKSSRVEIPSYTSLSKCMISSCISGILDTEGGRHMYTFGMSSNSKTLRNQMVEFLRRSGFRIKTWDWVNVKGGKSYSLGFRDVTPEILNQFTLRNPYVISSIKGPVA